MVKLRSEPFSRETFSSRKKISLRNRRVYGSLYTYAPLYCINAPTRIVFKKDFSPTEIVGNSLKFIKMAFFARF